jgi:hypothetical protein
MNIQQELYQKEQEQLLQHQQLLQQPKQQPNYQPYNPFGIESKGKNAKIEMYNIINCYLVVILFSSFLSFIIILFFLIIYWTQYFFLKENFCEI